jgi:hypothetical protein
MIDTSKRTVENLWMFWNDLKDNPLASELIAESAASYFRTAKKMEASIRVLSDFDRQRTAAPADSDEQNPRREEILAEAAELAWFFIIQREALRLPYYDEIFADFDISDEVKRRMGPRKTC